MDRIWRQFAPSDEDLKDFTCYPKHLPINSCVSITRETLFSTSNPQHNNLLQTKQNWQSWLDNDVPAISSTASPSLSLLMCPRKPASSERHDRLALAYKPRGGIDFKDVLVRLHVPGVFLHCAKRPTTLFRTFKSSVNGEECEVYMLCVDSILTNYTAMSATYFPKSRQLYGLFLGYGSANEVKNMTELLGRNRDFADNPFALVYAFLELERWHRFGQVDRMIDALQNKIVEGHHPPVLTGRHPRGKLDNKHQEGFYQLYTRVGNLRMQLALWNAQLEKLLLVRFPALRPPRADGVVVGPFEYIKNVRESFEVQSMRCNNVLEATSLAFQKELADLARMDANVAIGDAKQMKAIALLTMVFLPGTFVAGFMDAPVFDWDGKGHYFWYIAGPITGAIILLYFGWTLLFNRSRF